VFFSKRVETATSCGNPSRYIAKHVDLKVVLAHRQPLSHKKLVGGLSNGGGTNFSVIRVGI
jgi:hypothetical protein